jgi:methionyl-tRNA formyltransferase
MSLKCRLTARLSQLGASSVLSVLGNALEQLSDAVEQGGGATNAPKIKREEGWVSVPTDLKVESLMCKWRALENSVGIHAKIQLHTGAPPFRLKLSVLSRLDAPASEKILQAPCGALVYVKVRRMLLLRLADGALQIDRLQPEYKREMTGHEFAMGHHIDDSGSTKLAE